jgi:arginine/serine-rich splicing factor 4/5/6
MSKIYVGQLSDQTSEEALRQLFGEYGNVTHVEMRTGFAFVTFEVEGDGERAIEEVNDKELDGNRIRVERERGTKEGGLRGTDGRIKPPKRLDLRVLIRGLHPKVDWKDLKDWARGVVGEVTYSNVFDRDEQHMGLIELKV